MSGDTEGPSFVEALREAGDLRGLVKALGREDEDVRAEAAEALVLIGKELVIENGVGRTLEDPAPVIEAVRIMAEISGPEAIPVLEEIPGSYFTVEVVEPAFRALLHLGARLRDASAVAPCLEAESLDVCEAALRLLGELRDPACVPALLRFMARDMRWVTARRVPGSDGGACADMALRGDHERAVLAKRQAARVMGEILGGDEAVRRVLEFSRTDEGRKTAEHLGDFLAEIAPDTTSSWRCMLETGSPRERVHALRLLAGSEVRDPALIPVLGEVLLAEDHAVSQAAADALAAFGQPAVAELAPHLDSPKWGLRKRAILALKAIDDPAARSLLEERREKEKDVHLLQLLEG